MLGGRQFTASPHRYHGDRHQGEEGAGGFEPYVDSPTRQGENATMAVHIVLSTGSEPDRCRRSWSRYAKWLVISLLAAILLLAAVWGWLYWGWYKEQRLLGELKVPPSKVTYGAIVLPWIGDYSHSGPTVSVRDRVEGINLASRTDLTDFSPLSHFTRLERLELDNTPTTDCSSLVRLKNLRSVSLADTKVNDVLPLAQLTKLRHLDLQGTKVSDLSPLTRLTKLEFLSLHGTPVTDIMPLTGLTKLRHLDLQGTKVVDLSALTDLTNLEYLDLIYTSVTNVSPIGRCIKLKYLFLQETKVTDPSPLATLKSANIVLPMATITEAQAEELQRTSPDCGIIRR